MKVSVIFIGLFFLGLSIYQYGEQASSLSEINNEISSRKIEVDEAKERGVVGEELSDIEYMLERAETHKGSVMMFSYGLVGFPFFMGLVSLLMGIFGSRFKKKPEDLDV